MIPLNYLQDITGCFDGRVDKGSLAATLSLEKNLHSLKMISYSKKLQKQFNCKTLFYLIVTRDVAKISSRWEFVNGTSWENQVFKFAQVHVF